MCGSVGEQYVCQRGQAGDLAEPDADAGVPDPVGGAVVVLGQPAVERPAEGSAQPAPGARLRVRRPAVCCRGSLHTPAIGMCGALLDRGSPVRVWRLTGLVCVGRGYGAGMAGEDSMRTHGMADAGREVIAGMVLPAWDAFLAQAEEVDLSRKSRLPGWRAQEISVHLGLWPENTAMADLIASAREGGTGVQPDVDAVNARVTAAHRDAPREEVLAALRRNREATERYLTE